MEWFHLSSKHAHDLHFYKSRVSLISARVCSRQMKRLCLETHRLLGIEWEITALFLTRIMFLSSEHKYFKESTNIGGVRPLSGKADHKVDVSQRPIIRSSYKLAPRPPPKGLMGVVEGVGVNVYCQTNLSETI